MKVMNEYRKIPKISPGAYISQRPFMKDLFLEVNIKDQHVLVEFTTAWLVPS